MYLPGLIRISGLSTNIISHKLPINPDFTPVNRTWKFKPDEVRIKEEITKKIESKVVEVM